MIHLVDRLRADPDAFSNLAATLTLPARLDSEDPGDLESLLREAEERALDLLESEQQR